MVRADLWRCHRTFVKGIQGKSQTGWVLSRKWLERLTTVI